MEDATRFIGIWLGKHVENDLFEHLAMNGYTYYVDISNEGNVIVFITEDECAYLCTILNDRSYYYEFL